MLSIDPASTLQFSSSFFSEANAIVIAPSGNLYVSDVDFHRIKIFDRNGNLLSSFGSSGSGNGQFKFPWSAAVAPSGNVYVADFGNNRIQVFDGSGNFLSTFGSRGNLDGFFHQPTGVTLDNSGNVYVTDANNRIQKFDSNGNFISSIRSLHDGKWQFINPELIAIDESGNIYVPGNATHNLTIYDKNGQIVRTIGGSPGNGDGQFRNPQGVALDSRGNIYVTDAGNSRFQVFDPDGNFISSFGHFGYGNGEFGHVKGIAVDPSGRTYVTDGHNRIHIFEPEARNDCGCTQIEEQKLMLKKMEEEVAKLRQQVDLLQNTLNISNGNIGVGMTAPTAKLDVRGTTEVFGLKYQKTTKDARIGVADPGKAWSMAVGWANQGDFSIIEELAAGDRLYIKQGGNVGIGTINPAAKLDVNGDIKIKGSAPFHLRVYEFQNSIYTDYSTSEWQAIIGGFRALDGDIYEGGKTNIIQVFPYRGDNGKWVIIADFASHVTHEKWLVFVLFIRNELMG